MIIFIPYLSGHIYSTTLNLKKQTVVAASRIRDATPVLAVVYGTLYTHHARVACSRLKSEISRPVEVRFELRMRVTLFHPHTVQRKLWISQSNSS